MSTHKHNLRRAVQLARDFHDGDKAKAQRLLTTEWGFLGATPVDAVKTQDGLSRFEAMMDVLSHGGMMY